MESGVHKSPKEINNIYDLRYSLEWTNGIIQSIYGRIQKNLKEEDKWYPPEEIFIRGYSIDAAQEIFEILCHCIVITFGLRDERHELMNTKYGGTSNLDITEKKYEGIKLFMDKLDISNTVGVSNKDKEDIIFEIEYRKKVVNEFKRRRGEMIANKSSDILDTLDNDNNNPSNKPKLI